jgi:hypothetical protein
VTLPTAEVFNVGLASREARSARSFGYGFLPFGRSRFRFSELFPAGPDRSGFFAFALSQAIFFRYADCMLSIESICDEEWQEWYRMAPKDRWLESERLWGTFLALGGSLDPEPDSQSPFNDAAAWGALPSHGRAGLRSIRRSGI